MKFKLKKLNRGNTQSLPPASPVKSLSSPKSPLTLTSSTSEAKSEK